MALSEYKDLLGILASYAAIAQMFSGVFMCRDIAKRGTTQGVPSSIFVVATVLAVLMLQFASILNDPAMLRTNWAGLLLNSGYLLCYWWYCDDRPALYGTFGRAVAVMSVLLVYVRLEDPAKVEHRFGMIVTIILFYLIALPLFSIREIIRTKNSVSMPKPMVLSGTVVTILWLLYSMAIENSFMIYQNGFFLALNLPQLALIFMYPSTPIGIKKD